MKEPTCFWQWYRLREQSAEQELQWYSTAGPSGLTNSSANVDSGNSPDGTVGVIKLVLGTTDDRDSSASK